MSASFSLMKVILFDTLPFEKMSFNQANTDKSHELIFVETRLTETSAVMASGIECVCAFANDRLNKEVLGILASAGTKFIALRSAGFNHVDLEAAKSLGLKVVRVPEYSPYSVAEYAMTLLQTLNRKTHKAYNRVREGNFSLDGLVGFDLHGKTVGVVGTGKIGKVFISILKGFGCKVLAFDLKPDLSLCDYTSLEDLLSQSDIISLHIPLTEKTKHLINAKAFSLMKKGAILLNTGRGGLVDTKAMIKFLKSGHLGGAGLDVYEEEADYFFHDHSGSIIKDDQLSRLMTFPNVLLTSHQGFLTHEALKGIAETTLGSISAFENGEELSFALY